jgi:hypothetical protein
MRLKPSSRSGIVWRRGVRRARTRSGSVHHGLWGAAPVLDIGDHDPEQVYVFGSLDEDVGALVGEVTRKVVCIAVIQERCERKDLVAWLGELGRRNQE